MPGLNTSLAGGGVSYSYSKPLVSMTTSVSGVFGGEPGGANLVTVMLPLFSGVSISGWEVVSGLASQSARQLCVAVKVSFTRT